MTTVDAVRSTQATAQATSKSVATTKVPNSGVKRWFQELGWRHLVGAVFSFFAIFPFLFVLSASLNPTDTLSQQTLIPRTFSLRHYKWLFTHPEEAPFPRWLWNTVFIGFCAALTTVFLAALAAYAISRMRFKGRKPGLMFLLLANMFPGGLLAIAIYLLAIDLGDIWAPLGPGYKLIVILVYLGGALGGNVWLMKSFFDTLPMELDESARVDGAGHFRIFVQIILPLARPILATIFFFSFISAFNEFVLASVLLGGKPNNFTLSFGIQQFVAGRESKWGPFAAAAIIAGVPIMLVFQLVQKFLVSGLTSGAVKG